jgi:hypothetical protein
VREDHVALSFQAQAFHGDVDDRSREPFVGDYDIAPASQYQHPAVTALSLGYRVGQRSHVGHVYKCVCRAADPQRRPIGQTWLGRNPGTSSIGHP